ncbi:MafB family polymorphic toxin [Neisseria gonorrhoeae]
MHPADGYDGQRSRRLSGTTRARDIYSYHIKGTSTKKR